MTLLVLLACSNPATPPPSGPVLIDGPTNVNVSFYATAGSASPVGTANLSRGRQNEVRDPDGSLRLPAVDAHRYGEVEFDETVTIGVPDGEIWLLLQGFEPTGWCDDKEAFSVDTASGCSFDGWTGATHVWVGDYWDEPETLANHVESGGSIDVRIGVEEGCLCPD